jgi:hypothetical protein
LCACCAGKWADHLSGQSCDESKQLAAGDAASEAFIRATSKPCPNCKFQTSHFQGHGCHHISTSSNGCPRCHTHYCFACLATAEENTRDRGSRQKCRCPDVTSWSYFCKSSDVSRNSTSKVTSHCSYFRANVGARELGHGAISARFSVWLCHLPVLQTRS